MGAVNILNTFSDFFDSPVIIGLGLGLRLCCLIFLTGRVRISLFLPK